MVDVTYFCIELFNLTKDCFLNFSLRFTRYMVNVRYFCMELEFSVWSFFTQKLSPFAQILAFLGAFEFSK